MYVISLFPYSKNWNIVAGSVSKKNNLSEQKTVSILKTTVFYS